MGYSVFPAPSEAKVTGYASGPTSGRPTTVGSTYFDTTLNQLMILTNIGWRAIVDPIEPPVANTATEVVSGVSIAFSTSTWGGVVTGYKVTSSSGSTATGTTSPITVNETTAGTFSYFVQAVTAIGISAPSNTVSASFTPFSATGGTLTSDATYYYQTFTSSGTWTPNKSGKAYDVLIVAGGSGGGNSAAAGNSSFGGTTANGYPNAGYLTGGSGGGNRNGQNGTLNSWAPVNGYVGSSGGAGGTPYGGSVNYSGGNGGSGAGNGGTYNGAAATSATSYGSGGGGPNSTSTGNWGSDGGWGGQVTTFSGTSVANTGIAVVVAAGTLGGSNGMSTGGNGRQGVVVVRYTK